MTYKKVLTAGAALAAAASMLVSAPGAQAQSTEATLEVTLVGTLSVTAPATANLGSVPASAVAQDSGALGQVEVTDGRTGGILNNNWIASVKSEDFVSATTDTDILASTINYKPGTITPTGSVTSAIGTPTTAGLLASTAVVTTVATGTNSAAWNPVLSFVIANTVEAGTYTGTITHSVL